MNEKYYINLKKKVSCLFGYASKTAKISPEPQKQATMVRLIFKTKIKELNYI